MNYYSIRDAAKKTKLHREYIRALCDYQLIDCSVDYENTKWLKYSISDKGLLDLCMVKIRQDERKRGITPPP
jgi:hypothetical protein